METISKREFSHRAAEILAKNKPTLILGKTTKHLLIEVTHKDDATIQAITE